MTSIPVRGGSVCVAVGDAGYPPGATGRQSLNRTCVWVRPHVPGLPDAWVIASERSMRKVCAEIVDFGGLPPWLQADIWQERARALQAALETIGACAKTGRSEVARDCAFVAARALNGEPG